MKNEKLEHWLLVLTWTAILGLLVWISIINHAQEEAKLEQLRIQKEAGFCYLENADSLELL